MVSWKRIRYKSFAKLHPIGIYFDPAFFIKLASDNFPGGFYVTGNPSEISASCFSWTTLYTMHIRVWDALVECQTPGARFLPCL